jgi:hypothetical protein
MVFASNSNNTRPNMTDLHQSLSITSFSGFRQAGGTMPLVPNLSRFARAFFRAIHTSRRLQAEAELRRHGHLIDHAERHPLTASKPGVISSARM